MMVNDYEYSMIQKKTGLGDDEIRGHLQFLVVTRGSEGALVYSNDHETHIPVIPPTQVLDPTGVGDAFRGGFLTGLSHGFNWEICGKMGSLAATYCLESKGPQEHRFTIPEFIARFRSHFEDHGILDRLLVKAKHAP
jgi:adenosine kinase